jgi:hypothetical protein
LLDLPGFLLRLVPREGFRAFAGLLPVKVPFEPYRATAAPKVLVFPVLASLFMALVKDDVHTASSFYIPGLTVHGQYVFYKITAKLLKGK